MLFEVNEYYNVHDNHPITKYKYSRLTSQTREKYLLKTLRRFNILFAIYFLLIVLGLLYKGCIIHLYLKRTHIARSSLTTVPTILIYYYYYYIHKYVSTIADIIYYMYSRYSVYNNNNTI